MKSKWVVGAGAAALAVVALGWVVAQDRPAATGGAEKGQARPDEAAVREAAQAFAKAFEKGDAKAFAAFWTEDAEYVDEDRGEPIRGRAALAKAYGEFFAKRQDLKAEAKTDSVRFLGKDTAVEEGTFTVTAKDSPPQISRYSAIHVRQDGKWLIAMLKEWGDDAAASADLEDLAWLIGTWASDGGEVSARTSYEWMEGKKFIRGTYSLKPKKEGEPAFSGTQIIGVDPAEGLVRSWTFGSEGGIGEAVWTWDGGRWVIESAGTLPDGLDTTATNFLTRSGDDAFTWRSVQRTVGGEELPDLPEVKVKRVKGVK